MICLSADTVKYTAIGARVQDATSFELGYAWYRDQARPLRSHPFLTAIAQEDARVSINERGQSCQRCRYIGALYFDTLDGSSRCAGVNLGYHILIDGLQIEHGGIDIGGTTARV